MKCDGGKVVVYVIPGNLPFVTGSGLCHTLNIRFCGTQNVAMLSEDFFPQWLSKFAIRLLKNICYGWTCYSTLRIVTGIVGNSSNVRSSICFVLQLRNKC